MYSLASNLKFKKGGKMKMKKIIVTVIIVLLSLSAPALADGFHDFFAGRTYFDGSPRSGHSGHHCRGGGYHNSHDNGVAAIKKTNNGGYMVVYEDGRVITVCGDGNITAENFDKNFEAQLKKQGISAATIALIIGLLVGAH
jgi:hypothetical protein